MSYERAIRQARKLLELAHSANENEAAQAAIRAAEIMAEYQLSEAELRLTEGTDRPPERIITNHKIEERPGKRLAAWKRLVAAQVADSFRCKFHWRGAALYLYGRESAVQTAAYTTRYLWSEIERLANEAAKHEDHPGRAWKNAFRVGAAQTVCDLLWAKHHKQEMQEFVALENARSEALVLVQKDRKEVDDSFKKFSSGFQKSSISPTATSHDGYRAGREAGHKISVGSSRAALGAGAPVLKP